MREESRYKSDVPNDFRALPVLSFLDTLRARRARLTRVVPDLDGTANDVDSDPILVIPFSFSPTFHVGFHLLDETLVKR